MADTFRDFIPAGEDLGGQGSGFTDFVPTPDVQPVETLEVNVEVEDEKSEPEKEIKKRGKK